MESNTVISFFEKFHKSVQRVHEQVTAMTGDFDKFMSQWKF